MKQPTLPSLYLRLLARAIVPGLGEAIALRRTSREKLPGILTLLNPGSRDLIDDATARAHVPLTFGIALRGAAVLAAHDPIGKAAAGYLSNGLALFQVPELDFSGWLHISNGMLRAGSGPAPVDASVTIRFPSYRTALAALRNELDNMAALGAGSMIITGHVPLADTLTLVLDRMSDYFPPKP